MNTSEEMALGGFLLVIFIFFAVVFLIALIVGIVGLIASWRLYDKAGEPGWSAIIPIYNVLQMFKIAMGDYKLGIVFICLTLGNSLINGVTTTLNGVANSMDSGAALGISIVTLVISLVGMVLGLGSAVLGGYISYVFTKSYGKSQLMCILAIFFFPIILIIMGFDSSTKYIGPQGKLKLF